MANVTDDDMTEQNTNSLSSSDGIEQVAKRARTGPGPSERADVNAEMMPRDHSWCCANCSTPLTNESCNNVPLTHSAEDLKNMRLPVWISYPEVWKGTYCNCVSLCNTCLDIFYQDISATIKDINEQEADYERQKAQQPSSSVEEMADYLSPTGHKDMPTRQLRALMRTVLVQFREAIFGIMCNRDKAKQP